MGRSPGDQRVVFVAIVMESAPEVFVYTPAMTVLLASMTRLVPEQLPEPQVTCPDDEMASVPVPVAVVPSLLVSKLEKAPLRNI